MKNSIINKSMYLALLLITPLLISSCLSGENQVTSRVQVGLELQNMDDTLRAGQDTMMIDNIRLILSDGFFMQSDGDTLFFVQNEQQFTFTQQTSNPALLASGTFPPTTYQRLELTIPKAPAGIPGGGGIDPDFTDGNKRYTMIISGNYNGEPFSYKSERDTTLSYPFSPAIEVPEFNQSFGFLITNDVSRWFFGPNGLLDPNDQQNSKEINDNIFQSFQIDLPG